MKKRILIIGYNYHPEPTGIGKYTGEMVQWLAEKGHHCTVLTTYPYYPYWRVQEPYRAKRFFYSSQNEIFEGGGSVKVIRAPIYVPKNPSGIKRIVLDFSFLVSGGLSLIGLLFKKKYDVAIAIAPSFMVGFLGKAYKMTRHSKFVYHIQDLQIEAAGDLGMIKNKGLLSFLFSLERNILKSADTVSSISDEMRRKIASKAGKDIFSLPNWTDTAHFYPMPNREKLKKEFGFEEGNKVVLYSGGIGQKQGLEMILHAAKKFQEEPWVFVICGSGPYKEKLQESARNLENVVFLPLQPWEKFNAFLNMADLHLVIQKADAGDLMMPSKLTTILSVGGLSLITANEGSGLRRLTEKHRMGIVVDAENENALTDGIAYALSQEHIILRKNARAYSEQHLNKDAILSSLEKIL